MKPKLEINDPAPGFHATLWKLSESWPCDYVQMSSEKTTSTRGKMTIQTHNRLCRRCTLQKHLIMLDEKLKRAATITLAQWTQAAGRLEDEGVDENNMIREAWQATKEHAKFVMDEFLGVPQNV